MKKLAFTHSCRLQMSAPVTGHYFTLRIAPHDDPSQTIQLDACTVEPLAECATQTDGFGNLLYVGSCPDEHSTFSYTVSGTATVDCIHGRGSKVAELYRYPSPLTQPGPALHALLHQTPGLPASAGPTEVFAQAQALSTLVHNAMTYTPGSTNVSTTAEQAAAQGAGVCQDYAHMLAALLRASGIPARYVSGMMWGEGATHAWVEFNDGATWWGLDPTNNCEAGDYYIAIARGRDHGDCPLESGVFKGNAAQVQTVSVTVEVLD